MVPKYSIRLEFEVKIIVSHKYKWMIEMFFAWVCLYFLSVYLIQLTDKTEREDRVLNKPKIQRISTEKGSKFFSENLQDKI